MPIRNISLTAEMDDLISQRIAKGIYSNVREVVRVGLRALERDEQEYAAPLARLQEALDAGDASGDAEGDPMCRLRLRIRRRAEALGPTTAMRRDQFPLL
jgi:putative addiction module CopG family antidote